MHTVLQQTWLFYIFMHVLLFNKPFSFLFHVVFIIDS